jgi:hypothetical protein
MLKIAQAEPHLPDFPKLLQKDEPLERKLSIRHEPEH